MKMIKTAICTLLGLIIPLSAFCQDGGNGSKESNTRYYRHEVSMAIGGAGMRTGWSDDYENSIANRYGLVYGKGSANGVAYEWDDEPDLGNDGVFWTVSYYYHLNKHLAVGGMISLHSKVEDEMAYPEQSIIPDGETTQKRGYTNVKGSSWRLLPTVKWSWLNNRWCTLYSKASIGLHGQSLHLESASLTEAEMQPYKKNHVSFAWLATPLGWEVGRQKVRWFVEVGFGSNTIFQTGLTYRFKRFN